MSNMSRQKGKVAERELGHLFDRFTLEHYREQDGREQDSDFHVERQYLVECKRRERISILEWSRTVEERTPQGLVPAVAYRPNREPWRVSMLAEDWCSLVLAMRGLT